MKQSTVIGGGLTTLLLMGIWNSTAIAQQPQTQQVAQSSASGPTGIEQSRLFVHPTKGNDTSGNGTEVQPFKTITHALQVAQPNTTILLAVGVYNEQTGETFPLRLKPGVTLQGNSHNQGQNIVISGGGSFLSPTFAGQNITILGANRAGLVGVTVTNTNPRGYGLWIESSSPLVTSNTFTKSTHDGISVTGNSAPVIQSNYFYQNGANGITIYGTSRPEVRENIFEKTGFGINIGQSATPLIIGNRVIQNKDGVVSQAKAQPILRNNVIADNIRDGVVAIAQARPDLGTSSEPGGNIFNRNGRLDINSQASNQTISAFGNQLASDRTRGNLYLAGTTPVSADSLPVSLTVSSNASSASSPPPSLPLVQVKPSRGGPLPAPNPTAQPSRLPAIFQSSNQVKPPVAIAVSPPDSMGVPTSAPIQVVQNRPLPPIGNSTSAPTPVRALPAPNTPISIPVPPPQSGSVPVASPSKASPSSMGLLPVPGPNIPIGSSGDATPPPPSFLIAPGLRYRVLVEAISEAQKAQVKSLVPGAFSTFVRGRRMIQAGAFSERDKADELLQILVSNGLQATIEGL